MEALEIAGELHWNLDLLPADGESQDYTTARWGMRQGSKNTRSCAVGR
jgi:hypothetical protein